MGELEIIGEEHCSGRRDISVHLKVVERNSVPFDEGSANELGQNIHRDLDPCDRGDDTNRDEGEDRHDRSIYDNDGISIGVESTDTDHAQRCGQEENTQIPPLRDLGIRLHEPIMGIVRQVILDVRFPQDAPPHRLEAKCDLVPVIHNDISDGFGVSARNYADLPVRLTTRVTSEEPKVVDEITRSHPRFRVLLVTIVDEIALGVEDHRDVVTAAGVVPYMVAVDGQISGLPRVSVVPCDNPGPWSAWLGTKIRPTSSHQ